MTLERWRQIERLFHEGLARPAAERAVFFHRACAGDDELRREVESLITCLDEAGDFIERPALDVIARGKSFSAVRVPSQNAQAPAAGERSSLHQPGDTISHYLILKELGAGALSHVYEAEDPTLHRHVALKFLTAPNSAPLHNAALERFRREAYAATALNHPNICAIHEIGEHAGQMFIAMEFLEGVTLKVRLSRLQSPRLAPGALRFAKGLKERQGPTEDDGLPIDTLLDWGIQIADALDAAHEKGITHCYINPANIFITTRGQPKIWGFGISKLTAPSPDPINTGGVTDRVSYVSPEQGRREPADARTDLFSFGAVLYEMATGRRAFDGNTSVGIVAEILKKEPVRVRRLNPELPVKLEEIVSKCLEKDREMRYQSAAQIRADLKRLKRDRSSPRRE